MNDDGFSSLHTGSWLYNFMVHNLRMDLFVFVCDPDQYAVNW